MATEGGGKEMNEIKTQFTTREGLYKLLPNSEYSRPNRVPFNSQGSNPVRVSFVNLNDQSGNGDRLCFNVGRELYFYIYKGVRKAADLSKPIDKRIYKGTQPTCHDFNHLTATAESVSLLVGFSAGQVQLIDPIKKETSKLFNEEADVQKSLDEKAGVQTVHGVFSHEKRGCVGSYACPRMRALDREARSC
ncbi:WD repeat-containing protein 20 isoform X7 [Myotis myotis]|uniref:WD repeat-containing protein 20 isoform X7 n=1 Tax=Myotis myotis TaxID=51298 RepID=UPI00174CE1E4|nr:WD repeat-containing protein 20 isoform X7 [Myotis myotis]XP_036172408.1 WD repeat-containing protein 20 isoform X7 [Myotis myotis]